MVFLEFEPWSVLSSPDQLAYLEITWNGSAYTWSMNNWWSLPHTSTSINGISFAKSPQGCGAFILYAASGGNYLHFFCWGGSGYSSDPSCPSGEFDSNALTCFYSRLS